ncbi:MAG: hypothetical protein ACXVKK_13045, partial [Flavisolibacter sp.]
MRTNVLVRPCLAILLLFCFPAFVYSQAPANDNCAGAILLTSSTTCVNTPGTVTNATNSGIAANASCGGAADDDVWYKFVAPGPSATITLSGYVNGA